MQSRMIGVAVLAALVVASAACVPQSAAATSASPTGRTGGSADLATRSPAAAPARSVPIERVEPQALLRVFPADALVGPRMLAVAGGKMWLTSSAGIVSIDPSTDEATAPALGPGSALYGQDDTIWQTTPRLGRVTRYRVPGLEPDVVINVDNPEGVDGDATGVWVADHHAGSVLRLDPTSGAIVETIRIGPEGPSGPMNPRVVPSGIWLAVPNASAIARIDSATNLALTIPSRQSVPCGGTTVADDAVWVSTCDDDYAIHVDPTTNIVVGLADVGGPNGLPLLIAGRPWVPVRNRIVRIDPETDTVDRILAFGDGRFKGIATIEGFGSVWIGSEDGRIARLSIDLFH
jgi:streptogramin lyase